MIGNSLDKEFYPRWEIKNHYADECYRRLEFLPFVSAIKEAVDGGYCYGYNTVLNAASEVLSKEDYMKIVNKIEEWEEEWTKNNTNH